MPAGGPTSLAPGLVGRLADLVDEACSESVLVHGSVPPEGRDLDLVVRDPTAVATALRGAGLRQFGRSWVFIADCQIAAADVTAIDEWKLPAPARDALFAEARAVPSYRHLVHPSPRHELLVLARRLARFAGPLGERHRERIDAAVREQPDVWTDAAGLAPSWRCTRRLRILDSAHHGAPITRRQAFVARVEERRQEGDGLVRAIARAARSMRARHPRGCVIALSGIDGAGKSTQAEHLCDALQALGFDTATEWARLSTEASLKVIGGPVKRLLGISARKSEHDIPHDGTTRKPPDERAHAFRDRFRLVDAVWVGVVAAVNASTIRRNVRPHVRRGRMVVCDRYLLDSLVQLDWTYATERPRGWQKRLLARLIPRPLVAFWLDVPAEHSLARKPDEWDLEELRDHRARYARHAAEVKVVTLDGTRPLDDVCAEVVTEVLERLARKGLV